MKNKDLKTTVLRYVFYTLLTCVLCVGCADSPSFIEQIGKDVRNIQNEFEKGYKADTSYISIDTIIIDTTTIRAMEEGKYKYYRVQFVGTNEATLRVNYYYSDSLSVGNAR